MKTFNQFVTEVFKSASNLEHRVKAAHEALKAAVRDHKEEGTPPASAKHLASVAKDIAFEDHGYPHGSIDKHIDDHVQSYYDKHFGKK